MKAILAVSSLWFAALFLTPSLQAADPPAKPNILYLIADHHGGVPARSVLETNELGGGNLGSGWPDSTARGRHVSLLQLLAEVRRASLPGQLSPETNSWTK